MSTQSDGTVNSGTSEPKPVRRLSTNVRTLIALVACCAAILWTWRRLSDNPDPVLAEARAIQKRAIGALDSPRPADRVTAIHELVRLQGGDRAIAIPPLSHALEDPDVSVRMEAAQALEWLGPTAVKSGSGGEAVHAAATALIRSLNDPDPQVRLAAFKALGAIGSSLIDSGSGPETIRDAATAITGCLKDADSTVRRAAVASLGNFATPRLESMANPPIDRTAIMNTLVEMYDDRDAGVRRAVIQALASGPASPMGRSFPSKVLAEGLEDESAENRVAAVNALLFCNQGLDPWVSRLLRLAEHDPDPKVRGACLGALNYAFKPPAITEAAVPDLLAGLKSTHMRVRSEATTILAALKADARAAIPELLRMLNEPLDSNVVSVMSPNGTFDPGCAAVFALGRIAPESPEAKQVITALIEVMRSGATSRGGWAAVALSEFGPAAAEAMPLLMKIIKEDNPENKFERVSSAAIALGKIAPDLPTGDQAVAALRAALDTKDSMCRECAINALVNFGPRAAAAIPRIQELKKDRDGSVRNAAAKAVVAIEKAGAP
jgi:HEAT repeat protein